ncbi:hypothetical protein PU634_02840 [Oceanimonas pelagia]|uniref:DUF3300 domain-containing protein n=1 Tax=Oceanimonas pelagia TaxID=3028314 RepID=A0AA50Q838_9GAMM|nr:DUF6515 family protein [Oceanimonas pelagia]WMC11320.1 hypothetical protein PU634_02840 [Oceanimonas pelagia]
MAYSFVHTGRWWLPLLAALLLSSPAQADRESRWHDNRLRGYDQPYGQYRHQGLRHRHEHRHKTYGHYRKHRHYRPRVRVIERYHYSAPRHYYHAPRRDHDRPRAGISIVLPLGSLVRELPGGYISLHFNGHPYYYHGGNYYRPHRRGYTVVAPPGW